MAYVAVRVYVLSHFLFHAAEVDLLQDVHLPVGTLCHSVDDSIAARTQLRLNFEVCQSALRLHIPETITHSYQERISRKSQPVGAVRLSRQLLGRCQLQIPTLRKHL